jgi:hypothetical protein
MIIARRLGSVPAGPDLHPGNPAEEVGYECLVEPFAKQVRTHARVGFDRDRVVGVELEARVNGWITCAEVDAQGSALSVERSC